MTDKGAKEEKKPATVTLIVQTNLDGYKAGQTVTMDEDAFLDEIGKGTHTTYDDKPDILTISVKSQLIRHGRVIEITDKAQKALDMLKSKAKVVRKADQDRTDEYAAFKKAQEA